MEGSGLLDLMTRRTPGNGVRQGRPLYIQIADDLRSRILDGNLEAGDKLPSETELMSEYGVSRIVVREAAAVLHAEGLVTKHHGKGTFVRRTQPIRQRIVGDFYAERHTTSPFATAVKAAGRSPEWEHQTRHMTASKTLARRLGIEPGDQVVRTQYRFLADGQPIMLSTSFEPAAITGGTPIEQPEAGPITGVVPRMDSIGKHITHVVEEVTARAPRPYEREALDVPQGVPVMKIERTYYVEREAVETCDIIVAADRYALTYSVPVPPRDGEGE